MTSPPSPQREHYDCFVIGGGINGCGIARDAVGRGYKVALCEASDFGGGTSSASTKLVHGGLRYLEHYEFRLVREALMEREVLWQMAPHIIWPLRFVLPHHKGLRPKWLLRLGLFLYDHLGGRKFLPGTKTLNLTSHVAGKPLKPEYAAGFEYSDCWVEDSRLVVLNALDLAERGGTVLARTAITSAVKHGNLWEIETVNRSTGEKQHFTANVLINAAGPWVDEVLRSVLGQNNANNIRLVGGSHIVINRKFDHHYCYIFQNSDERIIFAIPYEGDFTLIGTTDTEHKNLPDKPRISDEEIRYLCDMASTYFSEPVTPSDVVWTYSGIRPLYDDGASKAQEATRDYVIKQEGSDARLINIFGGKITTYRKLAEDVLTMIEDVLGKRNGPWTHDARLPGGDFDMNGYDDLVADYCLKYPFLHRRLISRLVRHYGTRVSVILQDIKKVEDLGTEFGHDLYQAEVDYLCRHEWAHTADDILFRRTKLGIRYTKEQIGALDSYLASRPS